MKSKNLEIIVKKVAVDEEYARRLVFERSRLMTEHELKLDGVERSMHDSLPKEQFRQMIRLTSVTKRKRSLLKTAIIASYLGILIASGMVFGSEMGSSLGIRTDGVQDMVSETKSRMSNLKSAFLAVRADMGSGFGSSDHFSEEVMKDYNDKFYAPASQTNFLVNPDFPGVEALFPDLDAESAKEMIRKCWKGPYIYGQPEDFMRGAGGERILITFNENQLYLHHPGSDAAYDSVSTVADSSSYKDDDLLITLWKTRQRIENKPDTVNEDK